MTSQSQQTSSVVTLACTKHRIYVAGCLWCRSATYSLRACTATFAVPARLRCVDCGTLVNDGTYGPPRCPGCIKAHYGTQPASTGEQQS